VVAGDETTVVTVTATAATSTNNSDAKWPLVIDETLKTRCRRAHGWSKEFTERVAEGYRQFLELKVALKDWDGTKLLPTDCILHMWKTHILDTRKYLSDCMTHFGGQIIHHQHHGDNMDRNEHRRTTQTALQARFDDRDIADDVWNWDVEQGSSSGRTEHTSTPSSTIRSPPRNAIRMPRVSPSQLEVSPITSNRARGVVKAIEN